MSASTFVRTVRHTACDTAVGSGKRDSTPAQSGAALVNANLEHIHFVGSQEESHGHRTGLTA